MARTQFPVALVCMPFVSHLGPSIQLGLLKSIGRSHGFPVDTFHLNLDFASRMDPAFYEAVCEYGRCFVGDWLFSRAAFGAESPKAGDQFLQRFRAPIDALLEQVNASDSDLLHLRDEVIPAYLDSMLDSTPWGHYGVVGFSSTFQQNVASFALASRIKRAYPSIVTVFGGANFEGEMGTELVRSIDCIDYAVVGEADRAFPELLMALQEGLDPAGVAGVTFRHNGSVVEPAHVMPFEDMDELPLPDYDEYFERAEGLGLLSKAPRRDVEIPFQSARGCWWGQKHHCTFCGLNGEGMVFRAKSPRKVREELGTAARKYRSFRFEAVDNIMSMSYLKELLPALIDAGVDYNIFYELKSNLTRQQIRLLSEAGVRRVQPGIESLSTHVLRLMRKGVTAIKNVNTLRWCQYYGVTTAWNLLYGFPGETPDDYREQAALMHSISHLQPPSSAGRIWMERFSPIFVDRASFPVRYITPHSSYELIYPDRIAIDRVAYFFEYEFEGVLPNTAYEETHRTVEGWKARWRAPERPSLTFRCGDDFLLIEDRRDALNPGTYTFTDPLAALYRSASDWPVTAAGLRAKLSLGSAEEDVRAALNGFCELALMMRDGESYLSLALPATSGR